jgi:hypothetical protein
MEGSSQEDRLGARSDDDRRLASEVVAEAGPPRGHVVRVLEDAGIESAVVDQVASRLVPYTYT